MPKSIDTDILRNALAIAPGAGFCWLFEIWASDAERIYLTDWDDPITYTGADLDRYASAVFQPASISLSGYSENNDGNPTSLVISMPNITEKLDSGGETISIGALVHQFNGLKERTVILRHYDVASDKAIPLVKHWIDSTVVNDEVVAVQLSNGRLLEREIPARRIVRDMCPLAFMGDICGKSTSGTLKVCDHTLDGENGCLAHGDDEIDNALTQNHPRWYGGFPGVVPVK